MTDEIKLAARRYEEHQKHCDECQHSARLLCKEGLELMEQFQAALQNSIRKNRKDG